MLRLRYIPTGGAFCAAGGMLVCAAAQLSLACETGCGYDNQNTWTQFVAPITGTPGCVYDFPTGAACNIRVECTSESTAKLVGTVLAPQSYAGHFSNMPAGFAPIARQYYPGAVTGAGFSARLVIASEGYIETDSGAGDGADKLWTILSDNWTLAPTSTVCMRCGAGE